MTITDHRIVAECLDQAASVCVLTGAGVSAESGVATFRDPDGLWARFSPQELASMDGFLANPRRVWEWYHYRRTVVDAASPNAGHEALAALERRITARGGVWTLVTQNVDRLHQRAGSVNVLEVHGNLVENRCARCARPHQGDVEAMPDGMPPLCVHCGGMLRPNVVWFGENLPADVFAAAEAAASSCEVFLVVGTSAEVWPAAGLPLTAKRHGAWLVEVNPSPTAMSHEMHAVLRGGSAATLPLLLEPEA